MLYLILGGKKKQSTSFLAFLKSAICWRCTRALQISHYTSPVLTWQNKPAFLEFPKETWRSLQISQTWRFSMFGGGVTFLLFLLVKNPTFRSNPSSFIVPSKWVLQCSLHLRMGRIQCNFNLGHAQQAQESNKSGFYLCLMLGLSLVFFQNKYDLSFRAVIEVQRNFTLQLLEFKE